MFERISSEVIEGLVFEIYKVDGWDDIIEHMTSNFTTATGIFSLAIPEQLDWVNGGKGIVINCPKEAQDHYNIPGPSYLFMKTEDRRQLAKNLAERSYYDAGSQILQVMAPFVDRVVKPSPYVSNKVLLMFGAMVFVDDKVIIYFS